MSPGTYLQKRRAAAGLSLAEVSRTLAGYLAFGQPIFCPEVVESRLARAEGDVESLPLGLVEILVNVVPLDPAVYGQLVDRALADPDTCAELPLPQLCRACACSFLDPCLPNPSRSGEAGHTCHWAEPDLCSHCAPARPAPVAVTPVLTEEGAA